MGGVFELGDKLQWKELRGGINVERYKLMIQIRVLLMDKRIDESVHESSTGAN